MLPQFVKFTAAQIVEEECNIFNDEKAVAKLEAEKGTKEAEEEQNLSKTMSKPDFSVYKRFADGIDRVEETPGKTKASSFEWTWTNSQCTESGRKIRGRSTSVALPSQPTAQARLEGQALQMTPRKIRGRSTTPEFWLGSPPRREVLVVQDVDGKSMDSDSGGTGSSDIFFDAKERFSTKTL